MKAMRLLFALASFTCLLMAQAPAVRRAPSFALPDQNGQFHDLVDYRGKVVIVEIMKTSCPHCKAFTSVLEKLKAKYPGKLEVLSIVNPPDTREAMLAYVGETKSTSPLLFDMGQVAYSYVRSGRVELPRVFLVDQQGMIRGDVSYTDATKPFFEKGGVITEVDKLFARK